MHFFFFFNDTATTEIYTLSLHDALPISSDRCRLCAEMPSFWVANSQQAVNHTVSGVRVRSKTVPAVTEVRRWQPAHSYRPSPSRQLLRDVDLEDVGDVDLGDVLAVGNPAGWVPAGFAGARGVAGGAQVVAVTSVIADRAAA